MTRGRGRRSKAHAQVTLDISDQDLVTCRGEKGVYEPRRMQLTLQERGLPGVLGFSQNRELGA